MEFKKFIANNIYPVLLSIVNPTKAVLICMLYQELDEQRTYTETVIEFTNISPFKPGSKFNLIGKDLNEIASKKNKSNTVITTFKEFPEITPDYYYLTKGMNGNGGYIDILIPRPEFVRIKYTLDSIIINGGFPKSTSYIFKYRKMTFVKVEKAELEGSKVTEKKVNKNIDSQVSVIKSAYKLTNGPKTYHVVETIGLSRDIEDKDLRIPVPEYVFSKVYVDIDEVSRLTLEDGELLLVQINKNSPQDTITVYSIQDSSNQEKFSPKYFIKENLNEES